LLGNPRLNDMAAIMAKAENFIRKREFGNPEYTLLRAALKRYCEIAIREVAMTSIDSLELSPILKGKPEFGPDHNAGRLKHIQL